MSDIFLSYAREDLELAKRLAGLLQQQGWSVFWDVGIRPGKPWHQVLDDELNQARCVVVLWSKASIQSKFVRDEAQEGMEREILIPLLIENVRQPLGFRGIQTADFIEWSGEPNAPVVQGLMLAITELIGPIAPILPTRKSLEIFRDRLNDGTEGPEMVLIPAGSFRMGDIDGTGKEFERPVHTVSFAQTFAIGRYPVTFD